MTAQPSRSISGKTVLVTGGTAGIGKATAEGLARLGAHVAITGRDRGRTEAAARQIRTDSGTRVDAYVADMSSQTEVRRLASELLHTLPTVDVLVNNVGGYWNTRHVTADGLELTFALNHLAPFLLTNLLLNRLQAAPQPRVVTVSSNAHRTGEDRLRRPSGRTVVLRLARLQPVEAGQRHVQPRAGRSDGSHDAHGQRPPPRRREHLLRCGRSRTRPADPCPVHPTLPQVARPGRRNLDPCRFRSCSPTYIRLLFREGASRGIVRSQPRPDRCDTALADERRTGRARGPCLTTSARDRTGEQRHLPVSRGRLPPRPLLARASVGPAGARRLRDHGEGPHAAVAT